MALAAPASAPDGTLTGFEAQQGLNALESPSSGVDAITGDICPAATDNPLINLQNRRDAIETGHFGPLDPSLPNNDYWQYAAAEWNASIEFVKHARCGNCAAFNITTAMRECISAGSQSLDAWVLVEAGQLGYCEVFDFRCAAKRRCNMWVAGGPLTDDLAHQFTGYEYELEEYKSDAALFKFNPSHDSAGRFSSGSSSGGGNSAAARAGKLAKELESKLGDKSGPPHGFAADGARRTDDTDEDEENAHYDYIKTLPKKTQDAIERYTESSDEINGLLREHPKIFEQARELHASGEHDIQSAAGIALQAAGFPRGTPEAARRALIMDAVRIDKAIAEAPPMKERIVLRGLVGANTTLDVIVERANSDGVVKLKGVVSASTDPSVAQRFTLGADVDKPYVMEIRTKRGLLVEGISGQSEQEVLLRPNANYKILGTGTGKYSERHAAQELPTLQLQLLGNLGE